MRKSLSFISGVLGRSWVTQRNGAVPTGVPYDLYVAHQYLRVYFSDLTQFP